MRARLAVLASGGGSNLQAMLDYFDALGERRAADVALVVSDQPGAGALRRAAAHGVPTAIVRTRATPEGRPLLELLREARVDDVALAGYLRLVPADVVRAFAGRIVNVHPALLPAFGGKGMYGHHVHEAVIAAGAERSGATVHFVDDVFDHGAIIAQWSVPVNAGDTPDALAARVLRVEHLLYPRVVQALLSGTVHAGEPARTGRADDRNDRHLIEDIEHALGL